VLDLQDALDLLGLGDAEAVDEVEELRGAPHQAHLLTTLDSCHKPLPERLSGSIRL
jgi:hypothetical protein